MFLKPSVSELGAAVVPVKVKATASGVGAPFVSPRF
jgi:hypothetical protein